MICLSSTYLRVMAAAHWSLSMSKQIAPVTLETFGCHILVINLTCAHGVIRIVITLIRTTTCSSSSQSILTLGGLNG